MTGASDPGYVVEDQLRHGSGRWRVVVVLLSAAAIGGAIVAVVAATGGHTRVHMVTPFDADGALRPALKVQRTSGPCFPASEDANSVGLTNVYTCHFSLHDFICPKSCEVDMCWRDYRSSTLTMVCLLNPMFSATDPGDAIRVRVTNHPRPSHGVKNPLVSEPWAFELSNGEDCGPAVFRSKDSPPGRPPILLYDCGDGVRIFWTKTMRVDRSRPVWTIRGTASMAQADAGIYPTRASISDAWLAGNNSS